MQNIINYEIMSTMTGLMYKNYMDWTVWTRVYTWKTTMNVEGPMPKKECLYTNTVLACEILHTDMMVDTRYAG